MTRLVRTDQKSFGCLLVKTPYGEGFFNKAELGKGLDCQSVPDKRWGAYRSQPVAMSLPHVIAMTTKRLAVEPRAVELQFDSRRRR